MLRGVQAKTKASVKYQLYQAKGVDGLTAVSDIIPFGQRPELHTLISYLLG